MVWLVASVGSKLVEKIIFGFKTRRRLIENGLKQVKLVNNSGFQVSFERWMKFDQKWSGFSWFEKVEFVSNSFSWKNWLKSDEKVWGCLFFGSKLLEIVEVFSSFRWIELLFRVRSGFKISKVVSSSRIRSSFNWYRFFELFNGSKLLRAKVTAKRPAAWLNMQTDRWYHQPPHLQPERCFFLFLVRT